VIYQHGCHNKSVWDGFHIRNLGLAVQRRMGERFRGDAESLRASSVRQVARALGVDIALWSVYEQRAFGCWALLLALIPDLARWGDDEKVALVNMVRAKAGAQETGYLRLLQKQDRLREEIIKLGSVKAGKRQK
jgi:hypothetical protein